MLQFFPTRTLQAQILAASHLVVVFAVLAAIRTVKAPAQAIAQEAVQAAASIHVVIRARTHVIQLVAERALVLALVHVVEHVQTTALVAVLAVMAVAVVVTAVVPLVPVSAGTAIALAHVLFIATMKLLAVMTVITSAATLNGKDWRLAHGRTNYSSNG